MAQSGPLVVTAAHQPRAIHGVELVNIETTPEARWRACLLMPGGANTVVIWPRM